MLVARAEWLITDGAVHLHRRYCPLRGPMGRLRRYRSRHSVPSMKRILLSAFLLFGPALPASAGQVRYVDHNGSLMSIEARAGFVTIRYVEPKPSLWDWGVRPGTLLFEGAWHGPVLVGTAYVFGCGPIPYNVSGGPDPNGVLVLRGPAPVVAISPFCGVIGWEWTANSTLVFDPQGPPLTL